MAGDYGHDCQRQFGVWKSLIRADLWAADAGESCRVSYSANLLVNRRHRRYLAAL